jgi:DNA mismatch repair protein MutS2
MSRRDPLDLLHPIPVIRADEAFLRETVSFAFATGDVGDVLERVVEEMPIAPSSFDDEQFGRDVFLSELIARCMPVIAEGRVAQTNGKLLRRLIGRPPRDPAITVFRQEILRELVTAPELRAALERFYGRLRHLRELLCRIGMGSSLRLDPNRRRLDVLRTIVEVVRVGCSFVRAKSGLHRIGEWATKLHRMPELGKIVQLLAYEDGSAELDLRVRLGYDGRIRELVVTERREPVDNVFYRTWFGRLAHKVELVARGHRFSDDEVLARLVDEVFSGVEHELPQLFLLLGDVEFYLAALAFRDGAQRAGVAVSLPELTDGGERAIEGLFNPLLLADGGSAVPCNLHVANDDALVVVTGPNSGGKTRLLQAVALTQLLAQAGLFVPARSARIPRADGLFVSLIEEARADQREGRLGTELLRIRRLFERLEPGALVILDELCAGTNPSEGEEIFRLVVKLLSELRPSAFITTHLLSFAARLEREGRSLAPLDFLQVELDADERPTYQFVAGVATTSLAHRTAARLGVTEESLRGLLRTREPAVSRTPKAVAPSSRLDLS